MTSQDHPHANFRRALERGDPFVAMAAATELPEISVQDVLDLTLLMARKDPRREWRVAVRMLRRCLEVEDSRVSEAERCHAALAGSGHEEAAATPSSHGRKSD